MLGVILGGRIGYVLFYGLSFWAKDPLYPFKIWDGGMSFHGGMLGVIAAVSLFAWRRRRNVADVLDFTVPLPGLGLFFGRIGNFINGELWGKVDHGAVGLQRQRRSPACLAALRGFFRRSRAVRHHLDVHVSPARRDSRPRVCFSSSTAWCVSSSSLCACRMNTSATSPAAG